VFECQFDRPPDLRRAIEVAQQNLLDSTIVEKISPDHCNQTPFSELAKGAVWGDTLSHSFNCLFCDDAFILHAETYHGSVGYWEPLNRHLVKGCF
jgi:hypothetical protein